MTSPLQQKLKITGPTVITANRLTDGAVVWLTDDHAWSAHLAEAAVATSSEAALKLLNAANGDESIAVGAYAARVATDAGQIRPATLRERIRVAGPTFDFAQSA
jgi:predicted NAD/FAD-binding protein